MTSRTLVSRRPRYFARLIRTLAALAGVSLLAACAGQPQSVVESRIEAQHYAAVAPDHYTAPGPQGDPWGPYIVEASARYDVPQSWIRGVIHQESSGVEYQADGTLTISPKGAMGLMQVMPQTYDELRGRYALGSDPYDPHNNILAGTAYMRELYDLYGAPAFLAAYNAGPGRLDQYLANRATLPDETRRYVAMVGPLLAGAEPASRSPAEQLAMNTVPYNIPPGLRYVSHTRYARRDRRHHEVQLAAWHKHGHGRTRDTPQPILVASRAPARGHMAEFSHEQLAYNTARPHRGWRLISSAVAEPLLPATRDSGWAVQVGAFTSEPQARAAAARAHAVAGGHESIGTLHQAHGLLYRARLIGLSHASAINACEHQRHSPCMVLSPDAL
jgi:hypothetical protein